ncbi:MAG: hypothetical protein A2785_02405 [Candidatus Chisholmbacteria bacterium RIFCSPHIGHO2_01_FULL_49_18]|uniref:Membrane protein 6-pyruvoyl-tetrahydropterin synthase-related domain-containing protein n=2 Tax=Candidatus Chisholmiibacteriota TaxID=1817900 RepID=A0A1G1VNN8_9BACT|nr:MAG: hypothetical protein A2785_02405 [Candidatus Chisholmbacteria bacterium RIFCSPHIGHO2_01_FULL_49_18]OGY21568.1 MAG: hypothetical protein A3A65_05620 [Candidatus Chisholmbacteria bacterium RIFCSPLOWO2_01_FULL_49_14]
MRIQRFLRTLFSLVLHFLALTALFFSFRPIALWYLGKVPALGVDLYNSATAVAYHLKSSALPFNGFKDMWFGGYPLMLDLPRLSFYLMTPFAAVYGPPVGVQLFAMLSLFLLVVFSYLLFYQLSKSWGLSLLLSLFVLLSSNIYGALTWAGSIPYFVAQAFFPLGLLWGAKYFEKPDLRYFGLMIVTSGIGMLIHPLAVITFLVPSLIVIIAATGFFVTKSWSGMLKRIFFYFFGVLLASFIFTYDFFVTLFIGKKIPPVFTHSSTPAAALTPEALAIADFYKGQIRLLFTQTNTWLFVLLAIGVAFFVLAVVFSKSRKRALVAVPFLMIAGYTAVHPALNLADIVFFFRHDPYRAFWQFPIAIGALAAAFWGAFFSLIREKLSGKLVMANMIAVIFFTSGCIAFAYYAYTSQVEGLISYVDSRSELSSAFPEILSIQFGKDDLERLKGQLVPSFIDPSDKNKRLYEADAAVNIWWNALFDMPQARGYADPPIGTDRRWGLFWLDIAIANDTIVRDFGATPEQALANTLFLIDWNGIHYFEGGRAGSKGPSVPPSSYLLENHIFDEEEEVITYGAMLKFQTESGKPELHMEVPQSLKYFKVADRYTTPILYPTDASPVIFFGDSASYEDLLRILATRNLNSRRIIPVYGGEYIDEIKADELSAFDAALLSGYRYRNQGVAFGLLENYVERGGNVFIDSGGEVGEAESAQLPELFPITTSQRQQLGKTWELTVGGHELLNDIDFSQFGPPIYGADEWKLTTPISASDLREGSTVLLSHKGFPLFVARRFGEGQVVWSGMSLLYHFDQYKIQDEANLFIQILQQFTTLEETEVLNAIVEWKRPEQVILSTDQQPRGILFKEQGYSGWKARLHSPNGRRLPIYLAGPTYPGFMYVPLAEVDDAPITLEFSYHGRTLYWIVTFVNILVLLVLLDFIVLGGRLFGRTIRMSSQRVTKKVASWWEREEE